MRELATIKATKLLNNCTRPFCIQILTEYISPLLAILKNNPSIVRNDCLIDHNSDFGNIARINLPERCVHVECFPFVETQFTPNYLYALIRFPQVQIPVFVFISAE